MVEMLTTTSTMRPAAGDLFCGVGGLSDQDQLSNACCAIICSSCRFSSSRQLSLFSSFNVSPAYLAIHL